LRTGVWANKHSDGTSLLPPDPLDRERVPRGDISDHFAATRSQHEVDVLITGNKRWQVPCHTLVAASMGTLFVSHKTPHDL
jgi:hypothetical protein